MKLSTLTVTVVDGPESQAILSVFFSNDDLVTRSIRLTRQELDDLTDWLASVVR